MDIGTNHALVVWVDWYFGFFIMNIHRRQFSRGIDLELALHDEFG